MEFVGNPDLIREPEELMARGQLNLCNLGIFFGKATTAEGKRYANSQGLRLCQRYGAVPARNGAEARCPGCGQVLGTVTDRTRFGWRYRCPAERRVISPLNNTFLEKARLNELGCDRVVKMIYFWLKQHPLNRMQEEVGVASETAVAWYKFCRDVAQKVAWHDFERIGGQHDVVEVDQTHLFRRKQGRGMMHRHFWLFGGISRTTRKRFGVIVPGRDADTLLPAMQKHVDEDSFICSDQWRGYGAVDEVFSGHGTVDHSQHFPPRDEEPLWVQAGRFSPECLDQQWIGPAPGPGVVPFRYHTNACDGSWLELKRQLRTVNDPHLLDQYIGEYMYRSNILNGLEDSAARMERFLRDVARAYPGVGRKPMEDVLQNCECHECVP